MRGSSSAALLAAFDRLDRRVVAWMAGHGIRLLRLALGIVFVWFGALKIVVGSTVRQRQR